MTIASMLVLLLTAAPASADLVAPPPESCPDGSRGVTGREGPRCAPTECASDTDCEAGERCGDETSWLCIRRYEVDVARFGGDPDLREVVATLPAECDEEGSCGDADDATCERARRCVTAEGDETGTDETGTDETGTDETGTDETGTDETGSEAAPEDPSAPPAEAATDQVVDGCDCHAGPGGDSGGAGLLLFAIVTVGWQVTRRLRASRT